MGLQHHGFGQRCVAQCLSHCGGCAWFNVQWFKQSNVIYCLYIFKVFLTNLPSRGKRAPCSVRNGKKRGFGRTWQQSIQNSTSRRLGFKFGFFMWPKAFYRQIRGTQRGVFSNSYVNDMQHDSDSVADHMFPNEEPPKHLQGPWAVLQMPLNIAVGGLHFGRAL